jgi:hydroxymethylglutaryl-CoA lyase
VRADVIPQLADGAEVLRRADIPDDVAVTVLIPNERGLENALGAARPLRRGQPVPVGVGDAQPEEREPLDRGVAERARARDRPRARGGLRCEGVISVAFGCPYEGEVPRERVLEIARRLVAAGCEEIAFGDTTGHGQPAQVERFFDGLDLGVELTGHFHNTRGQGLANVVGALRAGRAELRELVRRAGRVPGAAGRDRERGDRGPRLDVARDGLRDGHRPRAGGRGGAGGPGGAGRPLGSHVLTAGPVEWQPG